MPRSFLPRSISTETVDFCRIHYERKRPICQPKYPLRTARVHFSDRPKTFPQKDLHGRLRFGLMGYKCFKRFQKFWVDLFGGDMIELPEKDTWSSSFPVSDPFGTKPPNGSFPVTP